MSWKIMPVHRVAQLSPKEYSGSGAVSTNYTRDSLSSLDPNRIMRGSNVDSYWDRGTGTKNAINALVLVNHNLATGTVTVYGSATTTVTTSKGSVTPSTNTAIYTALTATADRYIRADVDVASADVGILSLGTTYDLGNPSYGASIGHAPTDNPHHGGGRTLSLNFGKVTTTDCVIIARLLAVKYDIEGTTYDGIGGAGGSNPVALIDGNSAVYWGHVQFSYSDFAPLYSRVSISMQEMAYFRNV